MAAAPAALLGARLLAACGSDVDGATITRADSTPPPTATTPPEPTPTPVHIPATLAVEPRDVGNGETFIAHATAPGAARASVEVFGRSYSMARDGDRFWTLIGVPVLMEPRPDTIALSTYDSSGAVIERVEEPFNVVLLDRPVDILVLTPEQASVLTPESAALETAIRFDQFVVFDRAPHWDGHWLMPAEGWISTEFGEGRSYDGGPVTGQHLGTDIANDFGTPIIAPAAGRVAWVGEMPMRGLSVLIDHGAGVVSGYHHLQEWSVTPEQRVEPGSLVALMGSTGLSTGPHLHWELSIYGINVDPITWTERTFRL